MSVMCLSCQGGGIDLEKATSRPGQLLPLCPKCRGAGAVSMSDPAQDPYRAVFFVGSRFIVRITIPRLRGGFVEMDVDWSPQLPPATGRGALKPFERMQYEAGRDEAIRAHNLMMGGGDVSLIPADMRN